MREGLADSVAGGSSPIILQQLTDRLRRQQVSDASPGTALPTEDLATAVLRTMDDRLSPSEIHLLHEIAGLARLIERAKAEIAGMSVGEIRGSHIPSATGELDAIVEHIAIATDTILEGCEVADAMIASLPAAQADIMRSATTRIYEACSFQDITGQRISKVIKLLKEIEAEVLRMSGDAVRQSRANQGVPGSAPASPGKAGPASLLNGPMLPQDAMQQDDVDKLLADLG